MFEQKASGQQIVNYWKSLGRDLTVPELKAYSDNGPVRGILRDLLRVAPPISLPSEAVEIGAMYSPIAVEIGKFSRTLLVDPIYSESGCPDFGYSVSTTSNPLPDSLDEINSWLEGQGVLVLENVINYFGRDTVVDLLNLNFSHLIVGNNSGASFGDKHPNRLDSPNKIQIALENHGFNPIVDPFTTKDTLVGIYVR